MNFTLSQGIVKCLKEVKEKLNCKSTFLFFSLYFCCFLTFKILLCIFSHESCCIGRMLVMKLRDGSEGRASGLMCEIVKSVGLGNFTFVRKKSGNFRNLWLWQSCIMLLILFE